MGRIRTTLAQANPEGPKAGMADTFTRPEWRRIRALPGEDPGRFRLSHGEQEERSRGRNALIQNDGVHLLSSNGRSEHSKSFPAGRQPFGLDSFSLSPGEERPGTFPRRQFRVRGRLRNINAWRRRDEDDAGVVARFSSSVYTEWEADMVFIHQTKRSEWDDAYRNNRLTANDVKFAIGILAIFVLLALTF